VIIFRALILSAYILSAIICFAVCWYAWRRRLTPGALALSLLAFFQAEWCLTYVVQLISPSLDAKLFWNNAQFLGAVAAPLMYLAFGVDYNRRSTLAARVKWRWLILFAVLILGMIWSDSYHHLFRVNPTVVQGGIFSQLSFIDGPLFQVYTIYAYSLLVITTLIILVHYFAANHLYQLQISVILVGILIPWVATLVSILRLVPFYLHDITPLSFGISNLIIAWGLFRFRIFDLIPVARDLLIDNLQDGVFVLNEEHKIIDLNPSAERILGQKLSQSVGKEIYKLLPIPPAWIKSAEKSTSFTRDLKINHLDDEIAYEVQISSLNSNEGSTIGQIVVMNDISERLRTQEKLRQLAITDDLTGLFNRRYFSLLATQELERAVRYQHDLSIILLDVDFFKDINDNLGHLAGDQVLASLAKECFSGLRSFDICARYGGEEFIIALPETTLDSACQTAERLREAAESLLINTPQGQARINISLGVASLSQCPENSLYELINRADQALYYSKKNGRNQVSTWHLEMNIINRLNLN
jgi:diguanylate cyclase (GGDEF)-like protein/PAS domain S-box-containing protein